jgi:hypothetical protein
VAMRTIEAFDVPDKGAVRARTAHGTTVPLAGLSRRRARDVILLAGRA